MTREEKCIKILRDNGPMPVKEIPDGGTPLRRFERIDDFKISLGGYGSSESTRVRSERFAYLPEEHSEKEIIEAWMNHHDGVLEDYNHRSILYNTPEWLRDEIRKWLDEDASDTGGGGPVDIGGTCDICGEEYESNYPHHLRNDCEGI